MKTFREFILECKLVEGIQELPADRMLSQISKLSKSASKHGESFRRSKILGMKYRRQYNQNALRDIARRIKAMKSTLRAHDPLDVRFRQLENEVRGEQKRKDKFKNEYIMSPDGKYRRVKR